MCRSSGLMGGKVWIAENCAETREPADFYENLKRVFGGVEETD